MLYNIVWSEYTQAFLILKCKSLLCSCSFCLMFFSNHASSDICLRSQSFWSCCPPCFPLASLWSALWMTSVVVRSAVLCSVLWWVWFFYIPEGTVGRRKWCSLESYNTRPCNSTKQYPFNPTWSAFSNKFIIMRKKSIYIKGRDVLVWAV